MSLELPKSPKLKVRADRSKTGAQTGRRRLETEENVASETDCVFHNFVYQMYDRDMARALQASDGTADELPSLPDIRSIGEQQDRYRIKLV